MLVINNGAVYFDRFCLAKTVVIKYSMLRMQICKSTMSMFLNHCLHMNIHPLLFNPIAIVLLQGGFPGSLCDWLVYSKGCDIQSNAIKLRVENSESSSLMFH